MNNWESLKRNYEFNRVYKKGKYAVSKFLTIYMLPNNLNRTRIGITVSKKYGNSVKRNRIKRLIRENMRKLNLADIKDCDLVVIARRNEKIADYKNIEKDMIYLLRKLGLFDRERFKLERY